MPLDDPSASVMQRSHDLTLADAESLDVVR
jgi:hypothetical protein